jgi:hypothetical protein
MPYLPILIIVLFAVFYHRAASFENESSLVWVGLSLLISVLTWFVFKWGMLISVLAQAGLFIGITTYRMLRKKN